MLESLVISVAVDGRILQTDACKTSISTLLNHPDSASYQDDWGAYHCPVDRRSATHAAIGTNPQLLPSRQRATTTPAPIFFLHFFFRILVPSSSLRLRILVTHLRSRCPTHPSSSNPREAEGTHRIEVRLRAR